MLFTNAKIFTMEDKTIENGYIKIDGTKITSIGEMYELIPTDDEIINLEGKLVFPGFIDSHCHMGMWEEGLAFEGDDGNEITDPVTPHLRAIDAINPLNKSFNEALESGITTVVTGPGSANAICGQFCAIKTYGKCVDSMLLKAPVAMKMALGENPKSCYNDKGQTPMTRMATAALIREELEKTLRYKEDIEKYEADDNGDYEMPEYDAKCEALLPLLNREIQAHIHCHRADDIFTAIRICKEFGLRYSIVHGTEGHLIAEELANESVGVITGPIMTTRSKPELRNATPQNPVKLWEKNVQISISTDYPETPVHYLPICAGIACREGLPEEEALKAITINAAKLCDIADRVGSIAIGKDADLVIFSASPLILTSKPNLVVVNGRIVYNKES